MKELLLVMAILNFQGATAQTLDRAGQTVGGMTDSLNTVVLTEEMTDGVGLPDIHSDLTDINTNVGSVIEAEIARLEEFITAYEPREEVITVTVYRNIYQDGTVGDDGGHGDDGGDGGDDGGGGGDGGC